jgi:hypothetical protein
MAGDLGPGTSPNSGAFIIFLPLIVVDVLLLSVNGAYAVVWCMALCAGRQQGGGSTVQ